MSAMPPAADASPILAAVAARLLAAGNGAGPAHPGAGDRDQFASHFQRLLGKYLAVEVDSHRMASSSGQATVGAEPDEALAALWPFIEALGLTQPATDPAMPADATSPTPLAAPITIATASATAISAAAEAPQGQAHGLAVPLPYRFAAVPGEATGASPEATALADLVSGAQTGTRAGGYPEATALGDPAIKDVPAGRELSAQLGAAITAGKEAPHAPGTMAAAVQNVVSQAVPGRAMGQEAAPVISRAVGSPGWAEEIGQRVSWLANRMESRAELVLTPPQMGRIEVNLSIRGEQATASFVSGNPAVREALEAALPRLREALAEAGIQLGQAQVGAEHARQWAQQQKHGDNPASDLARGNPGNAAISSASAGGLSMVAALKTGRGLVDVFA